MRLFDPDRLPEFVGRFGECYGATTEAHIDGLRMAALTLVGCLVGPRAHVRKANGDRIKLGPLTWNTLIAAPSGMGRKSTTANTAISLARGANELWRAQGGEDVDNGADAVLEPREQIFLLPGGIGSSGEGLIDVIAPKNLATRALWLQAGAPSCLLTLDEAGPLFSANGNNGQHHQSMRRFLLEAYDGHLSGRQTVRGGHVLGGPCAVSSIGTVTTSELLSCLNTEAVTSGLMGRIVAVRCPMIEESQLQPFWREPDLDQVSALERWLIAAAAVERWNVRISESAERVWTEWYVEAWRHYAQTDNGSDPAAREQEASIFSRYQNLAQRLAAALTVAAWSPAPWPYVPGRKWREHPPHAPEELLIGPETMAACCLTVNELSSGVMSLVAEAAERSDGFTKYQQRLIGVIAEAGGQLDRAEAGQKVRANSFKITQKLAQDAREDLVSGGLLEIRIENNTNGRPREVWVLPGYAGN